MRLGNVVYVYVLSYTKAFEAGQFHAKPRLLPDRVPWPESRVPAHETRNAGGFTVSAPFGSSDVAALFRDALARIRASTRIAEDHRTICSFGGRYCGTPSERRAREWLAQRLAEATGADVRRETVPYRGWRRGPSRVILSDGSSVAAQALGRSRSTPPEGLCAPLIDLGRGTPGEIAALGERARGAILLVRHEFMVGSGHVHRRAKYEAARAARAAGFLIANYVPGHLPVTGSSGGDGGPDHIPCAGVSAEDGALLSAAAAAGERVTFHIEGEFDDTATSENLFATAGADRDEIVVLSAHVDGHEFHGIPSGQCAIDNGSGLAALLTVAEALRDVADMLPRRIDYALFTVEEWALLGSRYHLTQLSAAERRRRVMNVNLDSCAGADALTILSSGVPGVAGFAAEALSAAGIQAGDYAPFMGNSDHGNYILAGVPALRLCAGFDQPDSNMRFILTPADTVDKVTPDQLRAAAAAALALTFAAATTPTLPPPLDADIIRRITGTAPIVETEIESP